MCQQLRTVEVTVFDNERELVRLPVFPVKFIDESDGNCQKHRLIDRGKRYFEYSKQPSFLQYSGKGVKRGAKSVSLKSSLHVYLLMDAVSTSSCGGRACIAPLEP